MKRISLFVLLAAVALLVSAEAPNGSGTYYQNANGKKGAQLKTALCGILWETRYNPALSYNELWTAFHTTDVRSDGKIWDMYSDKTNYEPGGSAQGHNYSGEGDSYNREHSFPASWFGSNTPMYTDLHHIYPTDGYINNRRSNYPFGETNGNTYKSHNSFSKLGSCTVSGYTGTVFEPADEYKGDFARTYFYMVTCYEEKLADWYSKNSESRATIDGTKYPAFQSWQLNMLLKWAKDDPVSAKEIARNTAVKNLQGNRNPFIDYPETQSSATIIMFSPTAAPQAAAPAATPTQGPAQRPKAAQMSLTLLSQALLLTPHLIATGQVRVVLLPVPSMQGTAQEVIAAFNFAQVKAIQVSLRQPVAAR